MTARPIRRRTAAIGTALAVGMLLLTGCTSASGNQHLSLHDQLPESIQDSGVIKVGSDLNYAPVESKGSNGEAVGLDPDLAAALGKQLGVKFEIQDYTFDKLIPKVQAKEIDIAMSAITDTKERREGTDSLGVQKNEGVDFVDYFIAGTSMLVEKGNPHGISSLNDLCGKTVALQKLTTQDTIITRQKAACKLRGSDLTLKRYANDDLALAQLKAGNAEADLNDFPVAAYNAKTVNNGKAFEITGPQMQPAPYGIMVHKDNTQLRDVLVKAMNAVIISGEYDKILAEWNLEQGAAQNAVVNGG